MKKGVKDLVRIVRAVSTDQLAYLMPALYVKITHQTGRGAGEESADDIAAYYRNCFDDYLRMLDVKMPNAPAYLHGKRILEYGPGDVPGVALLFYAYGAEQVVCVDRFPMVKWTDKNRAVLNALIDGLTGVAQQRAAEWVSNSGHNRAKRSTDPIVYRVSPSGLSGIQGTVDLVISRAVLEHVNDLPATIADMHQALREGGMVAHQVDLKSHGLHKDNDLDFLTWSPRLWSLMYGHKGMPNRWRVNHYRDLLKVSGFKIYKLEPTAYADAQDIEDVRPHLASLFKDVSNEDLAWLGFWLIASKRSH